jgi:hypothetical protein
MQQVLGIYSDERAAQGRAGQFASRGLVPLSAVIWGANDSRLQDVVAACVECSGPGPLELIVVQEANTADSTVTAAEITPKANVSVRWLPGERGIHPVYLGAHASKYDHVLFLSENLRPQDDSFFQYHAALHSARSERNICVLGQVVHADRPWTDLALSIGGYFLDSAIARPRAFLDWRYFTWSNISLKKTLVRDWLEEGVRRGQPGEVGAIEFADRLSRRLSRPLQLFHEPAAIARRATATSLACLMEHRIADGARMRAMLENNAGSSDLFGFNSCLRSHGELRPQGAACSEIIEGIKAWARLAEHQAAKQGSTVDVAFAAAILELCFLEGFGASNGRAMADDVASIILSRFRQRWRAASVGLLPDSGKRDWPRTNRIVF